MSGVWARCLSVHGKKCQKMDSASRCRTCDVYCDVSGPQACQRISDAMHTFFPLMRAQNERCSSCSTSLYLRIVFEHSTVDVFRLCLCRSVPFSSVEMSNLLSTSLNSQGFFNFVFVYTHIIQETSFVIMTCLIPELGLRRIFRRDYRNIVGLRTLLNGFLATLHQDCFRGKMNTVLCFLLPADSAARHYYELRGSNTAVAVLTDADNEYMVRARIIAEEERTRP